MGQDIRNYHSKYLGSLFDAFKAAWDENPTSFNLSFEHFKNRINHKLNIDPKYSLLAFKDHQITGFLLNTLNDYKKRKCVYNGGTGVIPSARGVGLTETLYAQLIPKLIDDKIEVALLEVVDNNQKAIHIYQKIGFEITQHFKCFACRHYKPLYKKTTILPVKSFKKMYHSYWDIEPSFLDQPQQLKQNQAQEKVLEAFVDGKIAGYIILQPHLGRISQIAVNPEYRNSGVGSALLHEARKHSQNRHLTIMNIPSTATAFISFLEQNGFNNEIDQYEMELII